MNTVRSVLNERQVPRVFWPEAVNWCVHVQNICLIATLENETPEGKWSSKKPIVHYFIIFGCLAYAHIPEKKKNQA